MNICGSEFQEDGKEEKKRQKSGKGQTSNSFSVIPGLDSTAKVSCPNDENLAPLASIQTKLFQYGQTNFISTNTDNPQWSPGVCLNLDMYEGIFKIKLPSIHHQVSLFTPFLKLDMFLLSRLKETVFHFCVM